MSVMSPVALPLLLLLLPLVSAQIPAEILRDEATRDMLFYDITTQNSGRSAITKTFQNTQVIFKYRVIGTNRYLICVLDDRIPALLNLKLPKDVLIVRSLPVQDIGDYFAYAGYNRLAPNEVPAPSDNLVFVERDWSTEGLTLEQKKAIMFAHGTFAEPFANTTRTFTLVEVGSHPVKFLFIRDAAINELGRHYLNAVDNLGGPGKVTVCLKRIQAI